MKVKRVPHFGDFSKPEERLRKLYSVGNVNKLMRIHVMQMALLFCVLNKNYIRLCPGKDAVDEVKQ